MSLEAQITDLNITLKRLCAVLESNMSQQAVVTNAVEVEDKTTTAKGEIKSEPQEEVKEEVKKTKPSKKKETAKKEEVEEPEVEETEEKSEIKSKDLTPLLNELSQIYSQKPKMDKSKGRAEVLALIKDITGVERLDKVANEQLPALFDALKEAIAEES